MKDKSLSREKDKSPDNSRWAAAIAEAEKQIADYRWKITRLRASITISKKKIANGEPWPGESAGMATQK